MSPNTYKGDPMKTTIFCLTLITLILVLNSCDDDSSFGSSSRLNNENRNNNLHSSPLPEAEKAPLTEEPSTSDVLINNQTLTPSQLSEFYNLYGVALDKGNYWYDKDSGLIGRMGEGAATLIYPGHNYGALDPKSSNGNTGVFINQREITEFELQYLMSLFQIQIPAGYYILDSQGDIYSPANPYLRGNIYQAIQQSQGGSNSWSTKHGYSGGGNNSCSWVNIPGSSGITKTTVTTSGCG